MGEMTPIKTSQHVVSETQTYVIDKNILRNSQG